MELLRTNVFGNPHSVNPTSSAMTTLVETARERVLDYFNASPDEYIAIFTPNASAPRPDARRSAAIPWAAISPR